MTKRRAEQVWFHDVPLKRSFGSQLRSMADSGDLDPPSLLALLGSRCRKRPFYFPDDDEHRGKMQPRKVAVVDHRMCASLSGSPTPCSGSFQDQTCADSCASLSTHYKKRTREDWNVSRSNSSEVASQKQENDEEELKSFNSFQYWRIPLPPLDLSLINTEDMEDKLICVKDPCDAMET